MKIVFHRLAKAELIEARDYYDEIIFGLGENFLDEFEKLFYKINENPTLYPKAINNIRKCNLKIFPFSIYFDISKDIIRVLAISHHKRKPYYWKSRI